MATLSGKRTIWQLFGNSKPICRPCGGDWPGKNGNYRFDHPAVPCDLNVALLKRIMNSVPARDKKTKHRLPVPLRQPQQLALTDVVDPYNIGVHRYNPVGHKWTGSLFMPGGGNMCHPDLDGRTGSGGLVQLGSGEFVWVSSDALLRMRSGMLGAGAMGSGALGSSPGGKTEVPPVERKVAPPTEEKDVGKMLERRRWRGWLPNRQLQQKR